MIPFYQDNHIELYAKDCRQMTELADNSVQCVVTSPPYWGLRKYSGEQELIWGIKTNEDGTHELCNHQWGSLLSVTKGGKEQQKGLKGNIHISETWDNSQTLEQGSFCSLCGAWKGAYGLEPTPEMYVQHTIEILREIRRVLRKDGVVFWNIGDSYNSAASNQSGNLGNAAALRAIGHRTPLYKGLKPKDLCLIPFRLAIAAQEDGWWVRSVIIWSKPNPMPESVTDRPTESHEYLLMLTQSGKSLYWTHRDGGGTREKPKADYRWVNQLTQEEVATEPPDWKVKIKCPDCEATGTVSVFLGLDVWQDKKCPTCNGKKETPLWKRINLWKGHDYYWDADAVREKQLPQSIARMTRSHFTDYDPHYPNQPAQKLHFGEKLSEEEADNLGGRNIRTVWEFPTQPYPEAHFAVFPEKLPELCIKAATPEVGCCSKCGSPWERVTKVIGKQVTEAMKVAGCKQDGSYEGQDLVDYEQAKAQSPSNSKRRILESMSQVKESNWQPTCKCDEGKIPSLVLDPFAGAGTTLWVAKKLNRLAVGYEISEEYCELALERNRQQVMM